MSTKIYNAYICKLGFHYTHQIIEEIRKDCENAIREHIKNIPREFRGRCLTRYEDAAIVIYPLANGDILFQVFAHNLPYETLMPTIPLMITFNKIQDYHYQNQSDPWYAYQEPPLDICHLVAAEKDYTQREKDWNEVFNKNASWIPAEVGYTIPMIRDKVKLEWNS